ncbi:MAG TPA: hypothetical protein VFQ85_05920 [Mycobacteriales bacterium]|jgi:hypothetical protein|nr:hypothetical protein [Mycobacteriales bacterium]
MAGRIPRAATAAAALLSLLPAGGAHAAGAGAVGIATVTEGSGLRTVRAQCVFGSTLPSQSFGDTITVLYAATAHASGVVPVSTSVICTLRPATGTLSEYGHTGITLPGPEAATGSTAPVPRLAPALYGCVLANAAYLDGSPATRQPVESCVVLGA